MQKKIDNEKLNALPVLNIVNSYLENDFKITIADTNINLVKQMRICVLCTLCCPFLWIVYF
jgi:hypothetical protein